jgi:cation diffusion facilitator CzcD-associated flavoprotein CzcO
MPTATETAPSTETEIQHFDVIIVGAGLSGIGAARNLRTAFPNKTLAILESREAIGGTWDLFRYPGIRSDSDMYTLGYRFRPWTGSKSLADGPAIRQYIRDTAKDADVEKDIQFNSRMISTEWSGETNTWTLTIRDTKTEATRQITTDFLHLCSGYYNYEQGFLPEFPGYDNFKGQTIHPQHWPEDLDYSGKRVVIIGSGATAVTLVPAMAEEAGHVTMLQRSPSYVMSIPGTDPVAKHTRRLLGDRISYPLNRWKNVFLATALYQMSQRRPKIIKSLLRKLATKQLPEGYAVDKHFKPKYNPWDQRMCMVPDGDLFKSIRKGDASIVTDEIETFTEGGIKLKSGEELPADIIITATGLNLQLFGGAEFVIDGKKIELHDTLAYKGMMLSDFPNFAFTVGYTNASWTLKADLVSEYVVRLLGYMDEKDFARVTPVVKDPNMKTVPLLDFSAGYVLRSLDSLPQSGEDAPWKLGMSYLQDAITFRRGDLADDAMVFERATAPARQPVAA